MAKTLIIQCEYEARAEVGAIFDKHLFRSHVRDLSHPPSKGYGGMM